MSDDCALSTNGDTVALTGVLDFHTVVGIDRRGAQWLSNDAPAKCRLDLKAVTYCNSAGVALVLDWLRAARAAGKELVVENMPDDMISIAMLGGLDAILPLGRNGTDELTPPSQDE